MTQKKALEIFGLTYDEFDAITENDFRQRYRKLAKKNHSDLFQNEEVNKRQEEIMKDINSARDYLLKIKKQGENQPKPKKKETKKSQTENQDKKKTEEEAKTEEFIKRKEIFKQKIKSCIEQYGNYSQEFVDLCEKYLVSLNNVLSLLELKTLEKEFDKVIFPLQQKYELRIRKEKYKQKIEFFINQYRHKSNKIVNFCEDRLKTIIIIRELERLEASEKLFDETIANMVEEYENLKREEETRSVQIQEFQKETAKIVRHYLDMYPNNPVVMDVCDNFLAIKTIMDFSTFTKKLETAIDIALKRFEKEKKEALTLANRIKDLKLEIENLQINSDPSVKRKCQKYLSDLQNVSSLKNLEAFEEKFFAYRNRLRERKQKVKELESIIYAERVKYLTYSEKDILLIQQICDKYLYIIRRIDLSDDLDSIQDSFFRELNLLLHSIKTKRQNNYDKRKNGIINYFKNRLETKSLYNSKEKEAIFQSICFLIDTTAEKESETLINDLSLLCYDDIEKDFEILKKYMPSDEFRIDLEEAEYVLATYESGYYHIITQDNVKSIVTIDEFFDRYITLEEFFKKAWYTGDKKVFLRKKIYGEVKNIYLGGIIYIYNDIAMGDEIFWPEKFYLYNLRKEGGIRWIYDKKNYEIANSIYYLNKLKEYLKKEFTRESKSKK